jgi:voltage-gated potassium channel
MKLERPMVRAVSQRDNFIWLLFGLVFLLFSGAVLEQMNFARGQRLINFSLSVTLVAAVWSMEQQRDHWSRSRIALTLIVGAMMLGDTLFRDYRLTLFQLSFIIIFLSTTTYLACRQVLFSGNVDGNKIIGAICIYLLMGLVWAFAYLLCEELQPGSLAGLQHKDWHQNLQDVIYFSFVTLTTLGYGDMSPLQPLPRFLAYIQAVTGQFYVAILVASLIGIRLQSPDLAQQKRRSDDK